MFQTFDIRILDPPIGAITFEMKLLMFQILNSFGQFVELSHEDPYTHLKFFMRICHSFKVNEVSDDALKLKLSPYSL